MTEPDPESPVKPPQTRDGRGTSAVYLEPGERWGLAGNRVYVKRQRDYFCHPVWRAFRKTPTLRRELRGLTACRRMGVAVPNVVHYREEGGYAELALVEVPDAQPLDRALGAATGERARIVHNIATAIGRLHGGGWSHGALYPAHILIGPAPHRGVTLIDLEKARHNPLRLRDDLARFWRHCGALLIVEEVEAFQRQYETARHY